MQILSEFTRKVLFPIKCPILNLDVLFSTQCRTKQYRTNFNNFPTAVHRVSSYFRSNLEMELE